MKLDMSNPIDLHLTSKKEIKNGFKKIMFRDRFYKYVRLKYRKYFIVSRAFSNFLTFILRVYFQTGLLPRGQTLI